MEARQFLSEIETMKLEINSRGLTMNKAWVDHYQILKEYEEKLLMKEGDLVLRESNLQGREEGVMLEQSRKTSLHSDLERALEMKEKQLRQFRREIGVKEALLADQYKLIQQEKKEKEKFERKLEQVNFDLRTRDLLLADLQKKMVNNSVSLSREISELKIRLSMEKQGNESRKRKASISSAIGFDPTEPKSPRFIPSPQHRSRQPDSNSITSSTIESRREPTPVKNELNHLKTESAHDLVCQRSSSYVSNLSPTTMSGQPESRLKNVKKEAEEDDEVTIIEAPTSLQSSRPISPAVTLPSSGSFSQMMKSSSHAQHIQTSDGRARSSGPDSSPIGPGRESVLSKKNKNIPSPAEDKSLSLYCSQIPTGTNSLDILLTRLRMVQSNFASSRRMHGDRSSSASRTDSVAADGASPWKELSDEPVTTSCAKKKMSVFLSSFEGRDQTDRRSPSDGNSQADVSTQSVEAVLVSQTQNRSVSLSSNQPDTDSNSPWKALLDEYADTLKKATAPRNLPTGVEFCGEVKVNSERPVLKSKKNQNSHQFASISEDDTGGICFGDVSVSQMAPQADVSTESDVFDTHCRMCGFDFKTVEAFQNHQCRKPTEHSLKAFLSKKLNICEMCQESFRSEKDLCNHFRLKHGNKPFKCNFCSKRFAVKYYLTVHERIHRGYQPYKCDHCGKRFTQKAHLNGHISRVLAKNISDRPAT